MPVSNHQSAYMSVYTVVEELVCGEALPVGLAGALYSAIDRLRRIDAPRQDIGLAERISIAMHKLEWAVRGGDAAAQQALRAELQSLGSDWLETPINRH